MGSRGKPSAAERATLRVVSPAPPPSRSAPPPSYLSPAMKEWWTAVLDDYDLDRHHLHLLEGACGAWDRMMEARTALDANGLIFNDQNNCPKTQPEVAIERDSRLAFARLVRELDLDEAPPPEPRGRPPGLRSNRTVKRRVLKARDRTLGLMERWSLELGV